MGFFLVGRKRDGGTLVLISPKLFGSRQEAVDELSGADVGPALESECYVVDLDSATPVLVVHAADRAEETPAAAESASEPTEAAGVWETPADEEAASSVDVDAVDQAFAEAVIAQEAESADVLAEESAEEAPDLADALKRAAGTLESEGITAPDSIGPATDADEAAAQTSDAPAAEDAKGWPWDARSSDEAEAGAPAVAEPASVENAEAAEQAETLVGPDEVPAFVPDALEEPATDINELVTGRADETAFDLAKPVIMGSYGDEEGAQTQAVSDTEPSTIEEPLPIVEPAGVQIAEAADEPVDLSTPSEEEGVDLAGVIADLELDEEERASATESILEPEGPSGEIGKDITDVESLTCDDCVYLKTCPNKGGLTPSTCGSFQWESS
ncbi:MAG: hypothetical protein OEV43_01825 [Coriobacteriia bacterium]|nr:hypothetical protein [Coriobacteriia bacterium]